MFDKIVLASSNQGKIREFARLFETYKTTVYPQSAYKVPDVEETGTTFVENAIIKARHASHVSGLPAIADDSGLVVDALGGAPGIYSARYAGEHGNNAANNTKLLSALDGIDVDKRTARYLCVLVFMQHANDPTPIICQGEWNGVIQDKPSGDGGFGYDPVFYVPKYKCTAAQLDKDLKNQISHRAKALSQLMTSIQSKTDSLAE